MEKLKYPDTLTIQWLREMYQKREITPKDVVYEIIRRANKDSDMNIWITPPSMEKIKPFLNKLKSVDPASLPLWGIPFAIKDNIDLAGVPTTAGCPKYAYIPDQNATVVERLISAGAIPLGKTNMDQFATGLVGTRSPYGETHNSFNRELISGGSSSGSSVAVACGHAVFALGTDTAGSGRVPAALNGLVGYKPSFGAWPTKGVVPACASLDCVTVFTHSLEEALLVDSIVRGIDPADPWSRNMPHPVPKLPQKVYLPKDLPDFFGPYAEEYSIAWNTAVEKIKKLHIEVEYIDCHLFSQAAAILYEGPWIAERWADLGSFIKANPGAAFPVTEKVLRSGSAEEYNAASVFKAMHTLQSIKMEVKKLLKDAVLVMPTCGGTWTRDQVRKDPVGANSAMGRYTNHCNLLDLCAVAVPSDPAASNIPFGITMFSLAENENLICGTAEAFLNCSGGLNENQLLQAQTDLRKETTLIAVCGLHMRGFPLEKQMKELGAFFIREAVTAAKYQLLKLPTTPVKPGLIKKETGGAAINVEIWEMPMQAFGCFTASVPAPLCIGKVELEDGMEVPGFICEAYASNDAEDITAYSGWRNYTMK